MQKIKILGISPYKGMDEILQELAGEQDNVDMDGYVADRECALELVDRLPTENYDVIISRGGTATLLKKHVDIPVIDGCPPGHKAGSEFFRRFLDHRL